MSRTIELPIRRDVGLRDQCSHGKLWAEVCNDCEVVSLTEALKWMEPQVQRDRAKLQALLAAGAKPHVPT